MEKDNHLEWMKWTPYSVNTSPPVLPCSALLLLCWLGVLEEDWVFRVVVIEGCPEPLAESMEEVYVL